MGNLGIIAVDGGQGVGFDEARQDKIGERVAGKWRGSKRIEIENVHDEGLEFENDVQRA